MNKDLRGRLVPVALMALLASGLFWFIQDALSERVVQVGDKAPDFSVITDSGRRVTRAEFGGRLLVLNFWATWCPPCIDELPSLNAMQRALGSRGVVVLGVSVDTNEKGYKDFLRRVNIEFLTARDPDAGISSRYGTYKYPETYIINSRGEVVEKFVGPEDWMSQSVLQRLERLL